MLKRKPVERLPARRTRPVSGFTPSPQQATFFDWIQHGSGSCVLEAVAGAGKTTTLIHALELMSGRIFFGAYNKKIAEEIKERAPKRQGLFINTMHAAGFRSWAKATSSLTVDRDKVKKLYRDAGHPADVEHAVLVLTSLAKQRAFNVVNPATPEAWMDTIDHHNIDTLDQDGLVIKLADEMLRKSMELDTQVIDFDDMIYAPLVHRAAIYEHDWVLIDEAQDTNAARRALALRMLARGGRLVAVGDRHQAIYGFTGADANALDLIGNAVNAEHLPLTVTYRCPKAVVEYAQTWVSHIQAHETAPEGIVREGDPDEAVVGDAILCRFTKPLVELAYDLIRQGKPAKIEGRDIGEGLKALARRWRVKSLAVLRTRLEAYRERETAKLRAKERESQAASIEDKVDCLLLLVERAERAGKGIPGLIEDIDSIFAEEGHAGNRITLSTIHKAKGREWHRVFWLQTGPSSWARKKWELEQEDNLCYVAATRAKHELVLFNQYTEGEQA